jgi:hypothetical protein
LDPLLSQYLLAVGDVIVDPEIDSKVAGADVQGRIIGHFDEISIPIEDKSLTH